MYPLYCFETRGEGGSVPVEPTPKLQITCTPFDGGIISLTFLTSLNSHSYTACWQQLVIVHFLSQGTHQQPLLFHPAYFPLWNNHRHLYRFVSLFTKYWVAVISFSLFWQCSTLFFFTRQLSTFFWRYSMTVYALSMASLSAKNAIPLSTWSESFVIDLSMWIVIFVDFSLRNML